MTSMEVVREVLRAELLVEEARVED